MKLRSTLLLIAAGALLAGCVGMVPPHITVNLHIDDRAGPTVQGWGEPGPDDGQGGVYNSVNVVIARARPFRFTFPDGFTADAFAIDAAMLEAHLGRVERDRYGRLSVPHTELSARGRRSIVLDLAPDGRANSVWIYTCGPTWPAVLSTADGRQVFGVPIRQAQLETLFGGPAKIGHDAVLLGYSCK